MRSSQQRLKPVDLSLIFKQQRLALSLHLLQPLPIQNRLKMLGHLLSVFHIRHLNSEHSQTRQDRRLARASVVQHLIADRRQDPRGSGSGLRGPLLLHHRRPLSMAGLAVAHSVLVKPHSMKISTPGHVARHHSRVFRAFLVLSVFLVPGAPNMPRVLRLPVLV